MSGLVWERQINFHTSLWHVPLSILWASPSLWFDSMWLSTGLPLIFHVSFNKASTYFRCDMKISWFEWATSVPRQYFNLLSSFISNSLIKHLLKVSLPSKSFLVTTMSSYTNNVFTPSKAECLTNKVWSVWLCLYSWLSWP